MKNEFKEGDLVYKVIERSKVKLDTLFRANPYINLCSEDDTTYLDDGRQGEWDGIPSIFHATPENRQALVTLYGEDAVPKLPPRGSELTKKLLEKQEYVICFCSDTNDADCRKNKRPSLITCFKDGYFYDGKANVTFVTTWKHAVPVDMNGNEITEFEE